MSKPAKYLSSLIIALITISLIGCAGGNWGTLNTVEKPTESELRRDWKEYTVYNGRNRAMIFKIKDNRKIILNSSWIEVSSEDMMAKSEISRSSTWVNEIIGDSNEIFGYLVQSNDDRANVKIIDQNTVKLYYQYVVKAGP